jgi:hypothetical protein
MAGTSTTTALLPAERSLRGRTIAGSGELPPSRVLTKSASETARRQPGSRLRFHLTECDTGRSLPRAANGQSRARRQPPAPR